MAAQQPKDVAAGTQNPNGSKPVASKTAFHEESTLGKAYDTRLVRRLWPFLKPHAIYIWISLALLVLVSGVNLVRPRLMGSVVARAESGDADALLRTGLLLALVVLAQQVIGFSQVYLMQIAGARSMADLRLHVFRFLQALQLRFFDRTPIGRLVTRASSDVDAVGELFASGVLNSFGDLISLTGIVIAMLLLNWRLALIAFAGLPIVMLLTRYIRKRSREAFREIRTKTARLNAFLSEHVSGIAVVQAYARETTTLREFDNINDEYRNANKQSIFYEATLDAAIEMVSTLCIASVLFWSGLAHAGAGATANQAPITFELVVVFTQYIRQFFEPVSMIAQRYTMLQSAMAGAERIFQLLDETEFEKPAREQSAGLAQPEIAFEEAFALENVTFGYKEGASVLRNVSLSVKPGERIAIVGATGAGKTTVGSLLLRLYDVQEGQGSVRVLGKDVRDYDRRELRRLFAVVPQDVFLFSGTILSNVALTSSGADKARVEHCLRSVGAHRLVDERGLDATVDERGANFSAGERQLIAFARALYRDAPILLLDEATASVDSDTEKELQLALNKVLEGRAAIVIAHRLSTIQAMDRIVVFHKGTLVEQGTHAELLAKGGIYAKLHRAHAKQNELASLPPQVLPGNSTSTVER
jgi:ATP-binding cassette, subfamily B, multidrug efflux pump